MNDPRDIAAKAARVLAEAARMPTPAQIRELGKRAVAHGSPEMSLEEIQDLASLANSRAEQVAALLGELKDLLASPEAGEP